jgi:hypothetical protein
LAARCGRLGRAGALGIGRKSGDGEAGVRVHASGH